MTHGGMKKRVGAGVALALVALVLAGCSAEASEAPSQARIAQAPDESPAAQPSTDTPDYIDADADEDEFLRASRAGLRGMDESTDAELLAAGYDSCQQLSGGTEVGDVEVFPEVNPAEIVENWNDEAVAGLASETLCTEFSVYPG
jgi:hypothetical protein